MFYYRYRPISELMLKELRYNEIYFSSAAESNDPYDGKVFLSYDFDQEKWKRFLEVAWKKLASRKEVETCITLLSEYLAEHCPISYEEVINYNFSSILLEKLPTLDPLLVLLLDSLIKQFVELYRPHTRYTVSFSKTNNEVLMWSHYASRHKGFCLVFRAIDGSLYQDKKNQLRSVHHDTPNGIAPSMSYGLPNRFMFQDIKYCPEIEMIDASRFMPFHVFGRDLVDEEERLQFLTENECKCLEKHKCWEYETESRILLDEPIPWLFGAHFDYTQEERLLHFQPTQLVGIILGAQMEPTVKDRIREIIRGRLSKIGMDCKGCAVFDFVLFEAAISDTSRDVTVVPVEIYDFLGHIGKDDAKFESKYKAWEDGWAIEFSDEGNGVSRKQFL